MIENLENLVITYTVKPLDVHELTPQLCYLAIETFDDQVGIINAP